MNRYLTADQICRMPPERVRQFLGHYKTKLRDQENFLVLLREILEIRPRDSIRDKILEMKKDLISLSEAVLKEG